MAHDITGLTPQIRLWLALERYKRLVPAKRCRFFRKTPKNRENLVPVYFRISIITIVEQRARMTGKPVCWHAHRFWRFQTRGSYDKDDRARRPKQHHPLRPAKFAGRSYRFSDHWRGSRRLG